jgi:hypothetical protein
MSINLESPAVPNEFLTSKELETGLDHIRDAPKDAGPLGLIVRRPNTGERELVQSAELDLREGLKGDNWFVRGSSKTADGSANPEAQLTLMNFRVISLIARTSERFPLAGDQLFLDLDLSVRNFPTGARISLGTAVLEFTEPPHTGCNKFTQRFGADAMKFVNSAIGRELRLRGANAKVIVPGIIQIGNLAMKL